MGSNSSMSYLNFDDMDAFDPCSDLTVFYSSTPTPQTSSPTEDMSTTNFFADFDVDDPGPCLSTHDSGVGLSQLWNPTMDFDSAAFSEPSTNVTSPDSNWDQLPGQVRLTAGKTKTRAETQIPMSATLSVPDLQAEHIAFPRKTLARPKQLASAEKRQEMEGRGRVVRMDVYPVLATAMEKPGGWDQARRRARGEEPVPTRRSAVADVDKDSPEHPLNGGEVRLCNGCKERERKRYDRKKRAAEDEDEWRSYDDDRIVIINEHEFKQWKRLATGELLVEFNLRIACYCRHQNDKVGYRLIFTFTDASGNVVAQDVSEVLQITDDHKNRDVTTSQPMEWAPCMSANPSPPSALAQPPVSMQYAEANSVPSSVPHTPVSGQFPGPLPVLSAIPQPPVSAQFQDAMPLHPLMPPTMGPAGYPTTLVAPAPLPLNPTGQDFDMLAASFSYTNAAQNGAWFTH